MYIKINKSKEEEKLPNISPGQQIHGVLSSVFFLFSIHLIRIFFRGCFLGESDRGWWRLSLQLRRAKESGRYCQNCKKIKNTCCKVKR